jgi:hypothetical protein
MFPRLLRLASLALLLGAVFPVCAGAQQSSVKVDATVSTFRATNNDLVYKISYSYDFVARRTVFIDNVGLVPARGRLAYFSYDSNIIFRESRAERVLLAVSLLGRDVYTSVGPAPDFPDESDFPKSYRSGVWVFSSSFQIITNDVLNKAFPSGYKAYSANNLNYSQTTFTRLRNLPVNLVGEIAVLVSHPYDVRNKTFEYHIQFLVREKRIQSAKWRYESSDETRQAAEAFIDNLIQKLEEEAKRSK